ncbi:MAG TPA: DegQ family serine endoprotease [Desulfobacterales bacterium]|nr:DegQ family serine endoprotease [Desulfobacterales bacterium]
MNKLKLHQNNPTRIPLILGRFWVVWVIIAVLSVGGSSESFSAMNTATPPGSFSPLVKIANPSVVNISTVKIIKEEREGSMPFGPNDPMKDFFERYFGGQIPKKYKQKSLGTGFIIDKKGFILTNNHVVEQTDEIRVRTADDKEFAAKIVGRDLMTDLALIRIKSDTPFIPLLLGDSNRLEVGDWVVAIGNPFGLGNTVTAGIVSAKYRQIGAGAYDNFIQTDTPINPGNSGGPLLNTAGEVIGINTAIFSESGGSVGIGFAIPINMVKDLLPQLKKGKVIRGWIGVIIQRVTPELKDKLNLPDEKGALVSDVVSRGPAGESGIKRGDVIVSFDGKLIKESRELPYIVASTSLGKTVPVDIIRNREKMRAEVRVGELKIEEEYQQGSKAEPSFGMILQEITPEIAQQYDLSETSGLIIVNVENNSPAAEADLRSGDIILEVDRTPVRSIAAFNRKIRQYKKGNTILFLINRDGSTRFLTLTISE